MHITAPPSKAHTLRALFLAALADGTTTLNNPLLADDQKIAIKTLSQLGAGFEIGDSQVTVQGTGGKKTDPPDTLYVGNSGVSCRFLTAVAPILSKGPVRLDGDPAMRQRPLTQLLTALAPLGISSESATGCPPLTLNCESFTGGRTTVQGNISSQYLSAILITAPYAQQDVIVTIEGELKSKPYVSITLDMMRAFNADVSIKDSTYSVKAGAHYRSPGSFNIEGDYSNASYFLAAAAVTGSTVTVDHLSPESLQGDKEILNILQKFGCKIDHQAHSVTITGAPLRSVSINMKDTPDIVPTVAVVAAFAEGTTEIRDIAHLKYKETDRLAAVMNELAKMGIQTRTDGQTLWVEGGSPKPADIHTYNDHRIAMAFSVAKLVVPNIRILNPECVNKSFPTFFEIWKQF